MRTRLQIRAAKRNHLRGQSSSLQANTTNTIEGRQQPDRDGQFTYLNAQSTATTP